MKTYKISLGVPYILAPLLFLVITLLFSACKKDTPEPDNEANIALYELMKEWYYWYDQMPKINPNSYASPANVLDALKQLPSDRWSYVTSKEEFESYFVESKLIGYGFGTSWDSKGELRVTFVFNSVDIYSQGVRRAWVLETINGISPSTTTNINSMLGPNQVGISNTFRFRKPDNTHVEMTLEKKEIVMNTILHHEIIEKDGLQIGYMVLNGFTTPTLQEIDSVFMTFAQNPIDELILDLRYNGGGQTNVANHLASLIAGNSVAGEAFAKYVYNDKQGDENNRIEDFKTIENGLNLKRLVTICTRATASASEMVINGLRPFMDVIIIGTNTHGKPMGMNAWTYADYAFLPITFKIKNADDYGDYFEGLPVDLTAPDDTSRLFGDPQEASLQQALAFITTGVTKSMPITDIPYKQPREYMTGLRAFTGAH